MQSDRKGGSVVQKWEAGWRGRAGVSNQGGRVGWGWKRTNKILHQSVGKGVGGCKKSESGWGMSQSRGREGKKHIWIMLGLLKHVIMSVVLGIKARETHALVSHFDAKVYLFLKHT